MSLLSAVGLTSDYHADPYQTDPNAYQWGGPSQNELGGYTTQARGQGWQDYMQSEQGNAAQNDYIQQLQNAANGNGPSQAQGLLAQGANRAAADATSLARSTNAGNPAAQAAGLRAAMQQGAAAQTNVGAQASQLRAQEQQAAMSQLGGAINTQRGQNLQSMGQNQQNAQGYLGQQMNQAGQQLSANEQQQALNSANYNAAQNINAGVSESNAAATMAAIGAAAKGVGGAAASDARAKTDVKGAGTNDDDKTPMALRRGGNALYEFGTGLTHEDSHLPSYRFPKSYDPKKQEESLAGRANQSYLPQKPPPPTLDKVMAERAGVPNRDPNAPMSIADVVGPEGMREAGRVSYPYAGSMYPREAERPGWGTFGGAPQGPQEFAYPVGTGGMPGGLAIAMPPRNPPPPYQSGSDVSMKDNIAPQGGDLDSGDMTNLPPPPKSDERAKEEAFQAGMEHSRSIAAMYNPARSPEVNVWRPTGEYVGPGGWRDMYTERPEPGGRAKMVKEKVYNLADQAPAARVQPVATPRDVLMPPEHRPPVASERQAIEAWARAQEEDWRKQDAEAAAKARTQEEEEPTPTLERPAPAYEGYYSPPAPPGAPVGSALPRPLPPMMARGEVVPSDERMKRGDLSEGTKSGQRMTEADHFLETLRPYTYRYKDPVDEPSSRPTGGRYLGVMAQNLERAPEIGRQIVKDTPRGKVLEGGALMSALAGGLGRLHERVSAIEGKRG